MSRRAVVRRLTLFASAMLSVLATAAIGTSVASAETRTVALGGWQVQSSARAPQTGARISTPAFPTRSWLRVRPDDAGAVGTEVGALVQAGRCPNVFFSDNMKSCFGYMDTVGPDTIRRFSVPWWFRTDFVAPPGRSRYAELNRQRRGRRGRRVGQRQRGREAGHRAG